MKKTIYFSIILLFLVLTTTQAGVATPLNYEGTESQQTPPTEGDGNISHTSDQDQAGSDEIVPEPENEQEQDSADDEIINEEEDSSADQAFAVTVSPGSIGYDHTINPGQSPQRINNVVMPYATVSYNITWESARYALGTYLWTTIPGATGESYQPGTITESMSYRRVVNYMDGTQSMKAYSNIVTVTLMSATVYTIEDQLPRTIAAGTNVEIVLSGSQTNHTYNLYNDGVWVQSRTGTGSKLTFSGAFTSGTYTIKTSSGTPMNGSVTIVAYDLYSILNPGTRYAAEGSHVSIELDGSRGGVNYSLYKGNSFVQMLAGNNGKLTFNGNFTAGTYTVRADNIITMSGSVDLQRVPVYSITNPGTRYVPEGSTVDISLGNSQSATSYTLYRGNLPVESKTSTGGNLTFSGSYTDGTYTIKTTLGEIEMSGSVVLITRRLFAIENQGTHYLPSGENLVITMSGSTSGVSYTLYRGSTAVETKIGTGSKLSFTISTTGNYTIRTNPGEVEMTGSVNLTIVNIYSLLNAGTRNLNPSQTTTVWIEGSQAALTYHLYRDGSLVNSLQGTGEMLGFPANSLDGKYTVQTVNDIAMSGEVDVNFIYSISEPGTRHVVSGSTVNIVLDGSKTGIQYTLYNGNKQLETLTGTGSSLNFSGKYEAGTYNIKTNYGAIMTGNVILNTYQIFALENPGVLSIVEGSTVDIALGNSTSGVTYVLYNGATEIQRKTSTGGKLVFSGVFTEGIYAIKTLPGSIDMDGTVTITYIEDKIYGIENPGTRYISSGETVEITLNGSSQGYDYTLYKGESAVVTKKGTGNKLTFTGQFMEGIYNIKSSGGAVMSGSVTLMRKSEQFSNENYVANKTYLDEYGSVYNSSITYFDGFGRTEQNISVGASPDGKDIVNFYIYDCMGRPDSISYMSYSAEDATGRKRLNPLEEQSSYYQTIDMIGDEDRPYSFSSKQYDNSPLGLVLRSSSPGKSRNLNTADGGYPSAYEYRLNNSDDRVKKLVISSDNSSVHYQGYFDPGMLAVKKSEIINVNNTETYEYVNSAGQVLAKEARFSDGERRLTYYVYDDMGRKRYTIPPAQEELIATINTIYDRETLGSYSYYTEYDKYGNVEKMFIPGSDYILYLYDKRGRLIMSQNGNMRLENQWSYTKYDEYDRPVLTGIYTGGSAEEHRTQILSQTIIGEKRGTAVHGYTNRCYPVITDINEVLSATYYDDNSWQSGTTYAFSENDGLETVPVYDVVGQTTGSKLKVLGTDENQWLTSAVYYDKNYNTIQTVTDLYPGGKEIVSNKHNFIGEVVQTKVKQMVGVTSYEYNKWFEYDRHGRLMAIDQQITGDDRNGRVNIASYTYGSNGNLTTKTNHNGLLSGTYSYDILGRKIISDEDGFWYRLNFDLPSYGGLKRRYDGILSSMVFSGEEPGEFLGYEYGYDKMKQMNLANPFKLDPTGRSAVETAFHRENVTHIDKNGNIQRLNRTDGTGRIAHDITMKYEVPGNANAISSVIFNGLEREAYQYDRNGNLVREGYAGYSIEYNVMNLPKRIFDNKNEISYIYSAAGEKLAASTGGSLTYYRSVMVYTKAPGAQIEQLDHILQPEGLVVNENGNYTYKYYRTDHVGSVRKLIAARKNGNQFTAVLEQSTNFNAFGSTWAMAHDLHTNKYLYGGKEYQDAQVGLLSGGLRLYDFGSRFYDPLLGRWFNPDPKLQTTNPYMYCANSPMMYVDPDGEWFWVALLIGAGLGAVSYTLDVAISDGGFRNWNWANLGKSIGLGAVSGVISGGIGHVMGHSVGSLVHEMGRALAHGVAQGGIAMLSGSNFLPGFAAGALSSGAGSALSLSNMGNPVINTLAISGIMGGLGSRAAGGEFWRGAISGLTVGALNHLGRRLAEKGSHIFKNEQEAYEYMWENSFENGVPYKEHSAYVYEDGKVIMMPIDENTHKSAKHYAEHLKVKKNGVYLYNKKVVGHTHTHPNNSFLHIGELDLSFMNKLSQYGITFKIINSGKIYQVWKDGSSRLIGTVK